MFERFKTAGRQSKAAPHLFPRAHEARMAATTNGIEDPLLPWSMILDRKLARGEIRGDDPRLSIDPQEVRELTQLSDEDLMARAQSITEERKMLGRGKAARYSALIAAGREDFDAIKGAPLASRLKHLERLSQIAGEDGLSTARLGEDKNLSRDLLTLSAAAHDKRGKAMLQEHFSMNLVTEVAVGLDKDWIQARDALLNHGMLTVDDVRSQVRRADVEEIRDPEALSKHAFDRHDQDATPAILPLTRAMQTERLACKVSLENSNQRDAIELLSVTAALTNKANTEIKELSTTRASKGAPSLD